MNWGVGVDVEVDIDILYVMIYDEFITGDR